MHSSKLDNLKNWFEDFVASYYCDDTYINENIELKHLHTHKVCQEMRFLTKAINLSEEQANLAEAIALLHDVGRFEQVKTYRTFDDSSSINHSSLAIDIIHKHDLLSSLNEHSKTIVKISIMHHNARDLVLKKEVQDQCLIFAQLIRDADKIDIYRVVINGYLKYLENPEKFNLAIGFKDESNGQCSPKVLDAVLNGKSILYSDLKTLNDRKLLQLCWLYDINFDASLRRISQLGYIELIFKHLPETEEMSRVKEAIINYIRSRLS